MRRPLHVRKPFALLLTAAATLGGGRLLLLLWPAALGGLRWLLRLRPAALSPLLLLIGSPALHSRLLCLIRLLLTLLLLMPLLLIAAFGAPAYRGNPLGSGAAAPCPLVRGADVAASGLFAVVFTP